MTNQLKEFLKKINNDEALMKKFATLQDEKDRKVVIQKTIEIAREAGIELAEADFEPPEEMDDEELNAVAGGFKKCTCYVGGGGAADQDGKACGCVAYGYGELREPGNKHRCECIAMGTGYDYNHTYGD